MSAKLDTSVFESHATTRGISLGVRRWGVALGLSIFGVTFLVALFAPLLAPFDPFAQDLAHRLTPPAWSEGGSMVHVFGTDLLGRDYLSRLIYGARISLTIGISTVIAAALIGVPLGMLGGYFGGLVDDVVNYILTTRLAIPPILVALTVASLLGSSLTLVILTLGLLMWDRFAVVARTVTMKVRRMDFITAARAAGASNTYILLREILPNIVNPLIVVATLEMSLAIILEATLSFLGLGVPAPLPSWGRMIAEGKEYIFFTPWMILIPGVALLVLVLGINLLGDGARDFRKYE
jgi:peptide/nickel transport system permease protein